MSEDRLCNRTACKQPGADWWNISTRAWYCRDCATAINREVPPGHGPCCINPVNMPPTPAAPGPALGPSAETVEAAYFEWVKSGAFVTQSRHSAFKAGAEWAASRPASSGMTFEEWSYTPEAQALTLQWNTFEQRSETARIIWEAAWAEARKEGVSDGRAP